MTKQVQKREIAKNDEKIYCLMDAGQQEELTRLDQQHRVFRLTNSGKLERAPIPDEPSAVLDLGCGTAVWTCEFALAHPKCKTIGADMAPPTIPSHLVPTNVTFVEVNAETDWSNVKKSVPGGKFDYIHARLLTFGVKDWPAVFKNCFEHLKPGGWLEVADITDLMGGRAANYSNETSAFGRAYQSMFRETTKTGVNWKSYDTHEAYLKTAGFEQIKQIRSEWKIGNWGTTDVDREVGPMAVDNCLAIFNQLPRFCPKMPEKEVSKLQKEVLAEIKDRATELQLYIYVVFHIARKPE